MNNVQKLVSAAAARLGVSIIPNWKLPRWHSAAFVRQLFEWLEIDVVLDVGANRGQFRDFLRNEVDFRGRIVSWEPIPGLAQLLRDRAAADPDWRIEGAALGRTAGRARLKVAADSEFSSLHVPTAETMARFGKKTAYKEIEIEVRTLAEEVSRLEDWFGGRRVYLKLDTQGNDLAVLEGAGSALQSVDALQAELAVRPIYEGVPDLSQALAVIRALGFEPSNVFPNNEGHFPWLLELDMHFVAARLMPRPGAA